jgi:hypothetical protein
MCAPRRAAAVVRPRGREKSADRRRRILISRLLIIRTSVPRRKSPFPAYFKGFPAVSPLIPPYPAFLKYPVSPHLLSRPKMRKKNLQKQQNLHYVVFTQPHNLHYVVFANIYTMNIQMSRHWNTHIFIKFTERFFICQPPLLIILVVSAGIFIKI